MKNLSNFVHLMLPKSYQRTSIDNINMNCRYIVQTLSMHISDCIFLHQASLIPGRPRIASSSMECFLFVVFSRYSTKHHSIFNLIYFCLHSPTSLHYHQHGIYGQPGEESLFTEESRSPPFESTCRCSEEDSQSSLPIKCLNFQPSLPV